MSEQQKSLEDAAAEVLGAKTPQMSLDEAATTVLNPTKPATQPPPQGSWIDRGMAGMMWKPASGATELHRADNQVLGVPPELAAVAGARVGTAAADAGLSLAGRGLAATKATIGLASPIVKYEIIKNGLTAVGVPHPVAIIGAMVMSGYRRAPSGAGAAVSEAAEAAPAEATTAERALTPLEMTHKVRDEFRSMLLSQAKAASSKPKLTGEEVLLGRKFIEAGMSGEDALAALLKRRDVPQPVLDLMKLPAFQRLPKP